MTYDPMRRARIDQQTPMEAAIRAAVEAVEAGPADDRLTDAVFSLGDALRSVADFADGVPRRQPAEPSPPMTTTPLSPAELREMLEKATPGPWFVSGVRQKMAGGEWHGIGRYIEVAQKDEIFAAVSYDPRTGVGFADAHLIVSAVNSLPGILEELERVRKERDGASAALHQHRQRATDQIFTLNEKLIAVEAEVASLRSQLSAYTTLEAP